MKKQPPKERTGSGTPMYHGLPEMSTPAGHNFPKPGQSRPAFRAACLGLDGPGIMVDHGGAGAPGLHFPVCQPGRKSRTGGRSYPGGAAGEGRQKRAPPVGARRPPLRAPGFSSPGGRKREKMGRTWDGPGRLQTAQRTPTTGRAPGPQTCRTGALPGDSTTRGTDNTGSQIPHRPSMTGGPPAGTAAGAEPPGGFHDAGAIQKAPPGAPRYRGAAGEGAQPWRGGRMAQYGGERPGTGGPPDDGGATDGAASRTDPRPLGPKGRIAAPQQPKRTTVWGRRYRRASGCRQAPASAAG